MEMGHYYTIYYIAFSNNAVFPFQHLSILLPPETPVKAVL